MEIKEMSMEQLNERLSAIKTELETAENIAELSAEVDAINERKAELEQMAETRQATIEKIVADEVDATPIKTFEENTVMERNFAVDSVEYRNAWLKQQIGAALDAEERSAMATVDVVPTITVNTIINRLKENDLLKYIDFTQYKGYVNIPNYTTNGDASWGTANEQQDSIGHVALSLYQLIKTVEVPGVYEANAIDAFEAKMVEALANKIESALQAAVIVGAGAGSSQPTGIATTISTATGTFTKAGITKDDLLKIMGKLPAKFQKDALWIMPNKVFYEVMAIANIQGFAGVSEGMQKQIGGKPVVIDDACIISSTDTIFYGCGKAYHLNLGDGIKVAKDTSVGFKSNATNYRAVCCADGKLDDADAFVKYTRAS